MSSRALLEHRKPFDELEAAVLERYLARSQDIAEPLLDGLRYVIGFAKLTVVRSRDGRDHDVQESLRTHAWRVRDRLSRHLGPDQPTLWSAARELPELVEATLQQRAKLLTHFEIDRASLDREITRRTFVLVLGGGGGSGYGYAGVFTQLHREGIQPELICGTSIGAITGLFRARTRQHDAAGLMQVNKSLSWTQLFNLGPEPSRYGLPATLRMYLRRGLSRHLLNADGEPLRMSQLGIPMHIVATGLTVDALKHDLDYYEHFMDDVVKPGLVFRASRLRSLAGVAQIFAEFAQNPDSLREVVFGRDPGTLEADALDAAGFSASVPGLLHYDVHRDDPRMTHLLDQLYADYGITRLTEGGVVNNVPARPAFESLMEGRLDGHRNGYVLAVDCFVPRPSALFFYPIQQVARANVIGAKPYASLYVALPRVLNPANLVPSVEQVAQASKWAMNELEPNLPLMKATLTPFAPLP